MRIVYGSSCPDSSGWIDSYSAFVEPLINKKNISWTTEAEADISLWADKKTYRAKAVFWKENTYRLIYSLYWLDRKLETVYRVY